MQFCLWHSLHPKPYVHLSGKQNFIEHSKVLSLQFAFNDWILPFWMNQSITWNLLTKNLNQNNVKLIFCSATGSTAFKWEWKQARKLNASTFTELRKHFTTTVLNQLFYAFSFVWCVHNAQADVETAIEEKSNCCSSVFTLEIMLTVFNLPSRERLYALVYMAAGA